MNIKKIIFATFLISISVSNLKVKAIEYKTSSVESSFAVSLIPTSTIPSEKKISLSDVNRVNENLNKAIANYEEEKTKLAEEELEKKMEEEETAKLEAERESRTRKMNEIMAAMQGTSNEALTTDIYSLAQSYVGRAGDCFQIAVQFINEYYGKGKTSNDTYQVSEPEPGDLIYYANGGLGTTHYAVYLGEGQALQGNFNGTTVIASAYLNNASDPIFYRYN